MQMHPISSERRDDHGRYEKPEPDTYGHDELYAIWSVARAEANIAYDDWLRSPGTESYFAYRAAEDRADAAQDALAGVVRLAA
jgi:hypothetical protein